MIMNKKDILKVAIYARVSTDEQRESLKEQIKILEDWCEKEKYEILEIYNDRQSGKDTSRSDYQRMIEDIEQGNNGYSAIVILKLDRLGRSLKDLIDTSDKLKKHDIGLICKDDPIDTTTPAGRFQFQVFGALAEFERELIRYRTEIGMKRAKREGKICHRPRKNINIEKVKKAIKDGYNIGEIARMQNMSFVTFKKRLDEVGIVITKTTQEIKKK